MRHLASAASNWEMAYGEEVKVVASSRFAEGEEGDLLEGKRWCWK